MIWTMDLPQTDGHYWIRYKLPSGRQLLSVAWVRRGHFHMIGDEQELEVVTFANRYHARPIEWAGPIPEPGERREPTYE